MFIDFTNLPMRNKTYSGANGNKLALVYNDDLYMVKFPAIAKLNPDLDYANSSISEYLGSHIFQLSGIPAQDTLLGIYKKNGKGKIVVACKDFTDYNVVLQDFMSIKNTVLDSSSNGQGTELADIVEAIESQHLFDPIEASKRFWDMFIIDALIGNWDRHNGNWGFLYNTQTDEIQLSPVFDCGSSLYPQADKSIMTAVLNDPAEMEIRVFERPFSALKVNNQKINYFKFISSLDNIDCNAALKRIVPKIQLEEIQDLIDNTPFIDDIQKEFYMAIITTRKERILDFSLNKLIKRERKKNKELFIGGR